MIKFWFGDSLLRFFYAFIIFLYFKSTYRYNLIYMMVCVVLVSLACPIIRIQIWFYSIHGIFSFHLWIPNSMWVLCEDRLGNMAVALLKALYSFFLPYPFDSMVCVCISHLFHKNKYIFLFNEFTQPFGKIPYHLVSSVSTAVCLVRWALQNYEILIIIIIITTIWSRVEILTKNYTCIIHHIISH